MSKRQPISDNLISCRNILLANRSNENVLACLKGILLSLDLITVSSTRKIVEFCIEEVIAQVKNSDFVGAGMILNLIHNLPLNEASEQRWDIDFFLSIELPTFLEHFDENESSRKIVLFVCGQLALKYLPRSSDGLAL